MEVTGSRKKSLRVSNAISGSSSAIAAFYIYNRGPFVWIILSQFSDSIRFRQKEKEKKETWEKYPIVWYLIEFDI